MTPEEIRKEKRREYLRDWTAAHPEKSQEYERRRYAKDRDKRLARSAEERRKNPEKAKARAAAYYAANRDRVLELSRAREPNRPRAQARARNSKVRASRKLRQVMWANYPQIAAVFALCSLVEAETGQPHHVDHCVPLLGELVSGLHTHDNLQILTAAENLAKGNRFDPWTYKWWPKCCPKPRGI